MAEQEKKPCCCRGVAAIIIAVLALLDMHELAFVKGIWDEVVITILAVIIAIGTFVGCCCCAKFCKPKEGQQGEQGGSCC